MYSHIKKKTYNVFFCWYFMAIANFPSSSLIQANSRFDTYRLGLCIYPYAYSLYIYIIEFEYASRFILKVPICLALVVQLLKRRNLAQQPRHFLELAKHPNCRCICIYTI